jgi:hypothetical protein
VLSVDWSNSVDDVTSGQLAACSDDRFTRWQTVGKGSSADLLALLEDFRTACPMNRAIHAASAEK